MLSMFLLNVNPTPVKIKKGDYLGQLVLIPSIIPKLELVGKLAESTRGVRGFGSTDAS